MSSEKDNSKKRDRDDSDNTLIRQNEVLKKANVPFQPLDIKNINIADLLVVAQMIDILMGGSRLKYTK